MTKYLIVRHGSNAANQHMQAKKALGIPESRAPKGLWNEAIEHAALGGVL